MTILVTGGAGYVGSHCVDWLLRQGRPVVVVDDGCTSQFDITAAALPGATWVRGRVHDKALMRTLLLGHQVTAVMHFAASCLVSESFEQPRRYYENNMLGTVALLGAMLDANVRLLVASSTCAVYGQPQQLPIREDHPLQPINPYGWTKRLMEQVMHDYRQAFPLRTIVLRYFNAAGAHPNGHLGERHEPETHLIPCLLQTALGRRSTFDIYGDDYPTPDGTCVRDYIHVSDLAAAHGLALGYLEASEDSPSHVLNLGADKGISVQQMLTEVASRTQKQLPVRVRPRRPGDPPVLIADSSRARTLLGWQPQYSDVGTLIQTAWQWEQRQPLSAFSMLHTASSSVETGQ
jgi:UDP-glucose 4-epimerase